MLKAGSILVLALVAAFGGYFLYFHAATQPTAQMLAQPQSEMIWLKKEYHLTDAQFARIQELHREYAPRCDRMCERIANANSRLDDLIKSSRTFRPEVEKALADCVAVQAECRRALLQHVYAVSAEMSPADGARYVQMMKDRIVEQPLGHQTVISESSP